MVYFLPKKYCFSDLYADDVAFHTSIIVVIKTKELKTCLYSSREYCSFKIDEDFCKQKYKLIQVMRALYRYISYIAFT